MNDTTNTKEGADGKLVSLTVLQSSFLLFVAVGAVFIR